MKNIWIIIKLFCLFFLWETWYNRSSPMRLAACLKSDSALSQTADLKRSSDWVSGTILAIRTWCRFSWSVFLSTSVADTIEKTSTKVANSLGHLVLVKVCEKNKKVEIKKYIHSKSTIKFSISNTNKKEKNHIRKPLTWLKIN